jgi:tRNA(Ile)-lysidine synthase
MYQKGSMASVRPSPPPLTGTHLTPGTRLGVAVSGGADSVALLRRLHLDRHELALQLTVLHVHHGIRGDEADQDAAFTEALAAALGLPFHLQRVSTPALAQERQQGLEEAAREARYTFFLALLQAGELDLVATAHTEDDQAETVLHRIVRGAWTEGLGGIRPVLSHADGRPAILRPFLQARRAELLAWLQALEQPWREDSTNSDLSFTRNRIRHQLLPELQSYNPGVSARLAHMAALARDDEAFWEAEVARTLSSLVLPGRATRGGGRASSTHPHARTLAFEVERLRPLAPALARRTLRAAARQLGATLDFDQTATLYRLLATAGSISGRAVQLTAELSAERTPRELRLHYAAQQTAAPAPEQAIEVSIPGEAEFHGWHLRLSWAQPPAADVHMTALLRAASPSDRVRLRHSRGAPKKVKEVLERMGIPPADRQGWPVLELQGDILSMAGAALEPPDGAAPVIAIFTRVEA